MGGNSGGGGKSGRSGGGAGSGDAGQPGEVVREANARKETLDEQIARSYRELGMTPPGEMTKAERDAANTRNLESSRQSDIMEGGKSMSNPSVYQSNAPPAYRQTAKQVAKAEQAASYNKAAFKYPTNPKKGDKAKNGYGATQEWTGTFWR